MAQPTGVQHAAAGRPARRGLLRVYLGAAPGVGKACAMLSEGRRRLPGVDAGTRIRVYGTAGQHRGRLAILNPDYELLERHD